MDLLRANTWCLIGVVLLGLSSLARAQASLPQLRDDRVYLLAAVRDATPWEKLEQEILRLEQGSRQRYYVVLLDTSGSGANATREFTDRLFNQWARQGGRFDANRSVLIVIALQNRQVSVRAGAELQTENGLRGSAIDRELVQPLFAPLARQGDYAGAAEALVKGIERWITQGRNDSPAVPDRSASLRAAAEASVSAVQAVIDEAARTLEQQRSAGLGVKRHEERLIAARTALAGLQRRVESAPRDVMADGQALQADLHGLVAELRSLAVTSDDARVKAESARQLLAETAGKLEQLRGQGLQVASLDATLADLQQREAKLEPLRRDDPQAALEEAVAVAAALSTLGEEATALPTLRASRRAAATEAATAADALARRIEAARSSGIDLADLEQQFASDRERLAAASAEAVADERAAQNAIAAAQASMQQIDSQLASRIERHRLLTRTLPLSAGGTLAALGSLAVGSLWLRKRRKQREVEQALAGYRRQTTEIMERLDQLRERHRRLEVADPDFREPLQGQTLAFYVETQARLHTLWSTWLQLMDQLEKAQHHVENTRGLSVTELRNAEAILQDQKPLQAVRDEAAEVDQNLGQLEQVHEEAEAVEARLGERDAALREAVARLEAAGVDPGALVRARAAVDPTLAEARRLLTPDPLTARELFEDAETRVQAVVDRLQVAAGLAERGHAIRSELEAARTAVAEKRAAGLRLDESDANPDGPLDAARVVIERAHAALVADDAAGAARLLDEADAHLAATRDLLARIEAARAELPALLSERHREQAALEAMLEQARADRDTLHREHAADAWADVAAASEAARQTIADAPALLERAAASQREQHYLAARRDVERLAERHAAARASLAALHDHRAQLEQLRADCRAVLPELRQSLEAVRSYLREHEAIVASPARKAFEEAETLEVRIERRIEESAPHWPLVHQKIARCREGLVIARERAERDVSAHREVQARRDAVHAKANELGGLLRRENKDRAPTNLRYRNAADALGQIDQQARRPDADWPDLLRRLQLAEIELTRAEELARQDLRLANQAIGDIDSASHVVRNARGFNVLGFVADVAPAEQQLTQAQHALARQEYEQAIRLASSAEQSARSAVQTAERQAELRQQQIEAERRRRAAEVMARRTGRFPIPGGLPQHEWRVGRGGLRIPGGIVILPGGLSWGGGGRRDSGGGFGGGASQSTWDVGGGDSGTSSSNW